MNHDTNNGALQTVWAGTVVQHPIFPVHEESASDDR
jgi:hypothetical protein